jgi:hypothetical protein
MRIAEESVSVGQVVGLSIAGIGILELVAAVLITAARGRGDRKGAQAIGFALIVAVILVTVGVAVAAPA